MTDEELLDEQEIEGFGLLIGLSLIHGTALTYRGILVQFEGFIMTMSLGQNILKVDLGPLAEGKPIDTKHALENYAHNGLNWIKADWRDRLN